MSKIGKKPVTIPNDVKVQIKDKEIIIKGQKRELTVELLPQIGVELKGSNVTVFLKDEEDSRSPAFWGLTRALINNAIIGVTEGFFKELELIGVGYRVEKNGEDLKFSIGYSHPVEVKAPEGIKFEVEGNTNIKVLGYDKQKVGQIAAEIRAVRKPEPYKGKGIRYKGEIVKRKQGRVGKVTT